MGADSQSPIFYNRVKGDMEAAVCTLGYSSVVIARPSLLAGDRETLGQPARSGERLGMIVSRWMRPLIPHNYRSIAGADVAHALVAAVRKNKTGVKTLLSGDMQGTARAD